ncbi:uncharacterized protein K452DRAFT_321071 [Aplosporella prunicola CBS 121167]|uniref:Prolyl 4-hydroxylase alpha subunit domain-containing protein n=1 Tax=Aplosporella prunicola CBS 121167 TaxID=1176127 RepID=A0A6A6B2R2_9PEZI|nr:uncharacterized protein K452DRAFT_321071 [Aplosporella prunicola CBS 121167]KAF2138502.1 hypothetical protein K452DRAFT_321071 [Aplosporella prunicola CBS 121167]
MAVSLGTVIQYLFYTVVLYVLVGAPISRILFNPRATESADTVTEFINSDRLAIPDESLVCPEHHYQTHILNRDPLVIYIEDFLSGEEAKHIIDISEENFKPSTVWTGDEERLDPSVRVSEKAQLDRTNIVRCIEERARIFQGWRPWTFIEKLWSQRYGPGGHYVHHFDGPATTFRGGIIGGRISSFMVYVDANCTGGGTNFPVMPMPEDKKWCELLDCEDSEHEGVTFKPISRNAVYWENFRADGSMYEEAWHAGLPVMTGTKVGLNIWSWAQPGYRPPKEAKETEEAKEERSLEEEKTEL